MSSPHNPPGDPPPPWNAPLPPGYTLLQQSQVTPTMSAWAQQLDNQYAGAILAGDDTNLWRIFTQDFDGVTVAAWLNWHTEHAGHQGLYLGVTLFFPPPTIVETTEGIDISSWQFKAGPVDFARVYAAGKRFVYFKGTQGVSYALPNFFTKVTVAQSENLKCGGYHWFTPGISGAEQALWFLENTDMDLELKPALDVEQRGIVSVAEYVKEINDWISLVSADTGKRCRIYTSPSFWKNLGSPQVDADLWIAAWRYHDAPLVPPFAKPELWQYNDQGHVDGISGDVDVDRFLGPIDELC